VTERRWLPWVLLVVAGAGVSQLQPRLAGQLHKLRGREDVYVLPPPKQLKAFTLGYHAAAVDHLWAKTLIEFGRHGVERHDFVDAPLYVDAMIELEPDYAPIYKYVDTLMVYRRKGPGTEDDARLARAYLRRGTRERPYDHEVWMHYGQFLAFLSASFLKDKDEIDQWRLEGANAITRAVELGADVDRGLSAAGVLTRRGERDAAIKHLQRWYAITEDPQQREAIAARLQALQQSELEDRAIRNVKIVEGEWRSSLPFLTRGEFLMLAPDPNAARCAGPASASDPECPRSWEDAIEARR
jgi:hypothetical protein